MEWAECMEWVTIHLVTIRSDILLGDITACTVTVMTASTVVVTATIHGLTADLLLS